MMNMCKRPQKVIHRFILHHGQDNEEINNSKDFNNVIIKSILEQDGFLIFRRHRKNCCIQHLSLHQLNGNSTTNGNRTKVGILRDPLPGLNCSDFFRDAFSFSACQKVDSLAIDVVCRQIHLPHATFSHAQSLHSTDDMCSLAQGA